MQVKGTVDVVWSETKSTRAGDKTIHYGQVDDGTVVNLGFKPVWEEGEYVNVQVAEKFGELQIDRSGKGSKPKSATGSSAKPAPAPSKGGFSKSVGKFPIEPTDSQVSIIRQSSLNRAVEVVRDLVSAGLLTPTNNDEYEAEVVRLAYEFTDFATGQREVKAASLKDVQRKALEAVNG
jgi:hypothetical protein